MAGRVIDQTKYICPHRSYCQIYIESNCLGKLKDYDGKCKKDGQQFVVRQYIIGKLNNSENDSKYIY